MTKRKIGSAILFCMIWILITPKSYGQKETFEDEGPSVPTDGINYLRNFSQGGINFTSNGKMVVFGNTGSAFGANGSHYYLHTQSPITGPGNIGGFAITNPGTSFKISSFAAYVASDGGGSNFTSGTVTFIATLASGGTVTEDIIINSTNIGSGFDLSNSFSHALNAQITSLSILVPAGIGYLALDDIEFTTAPITQSQYSINDVTTTEGNSGSKNFTFTVSRTQTSTPGSVTVSTSNGTATGGTDYVAIAGQVVSFGVNESSKSVNVVVNGETSLESDETFFVNLSAPVNGVIFKGVGIGTILDDDSVTENFEGETNNSKNFSQNSFSFSATGSLLISQNGGTVAGPGTLDTRVGDGPTSAGTVGTFGITTPATSFNMVSIEIFTSGNDGASAQNGTVTFTGTKADGSGTVTHPAIFIASGNNFTLVNFAGTPFANVQLTSVSVSISAGLNYVALDNFKFGTGSIAQPQVSINDVAMIEGTGAGNSNMVFTLTRTVTTGAYSVDVSLTNVTTDAADFVAAFPTTTVNFVAGGSATQTVTVAINRDAVAEANEVFHMVLSNPTNGLAILDGLGIGTVNDDDGIIETFEDDASNATVFTQNGVAFTSTGHLKVRTTSGLGSNSSNKFLDTGISDGPTPVGSAGTISISTVNKAFKIIAIDVWTSSNDGAVASQSNGVIKFRGTRVDGSGTVETDKTITPSGDIPSGWVKNISFTGTPLNDVALSSLEVIIVSGANYVSLDNFSYVTINSDPEIEIENDANQLVANGSTSPSTTNSTDFGSLCIGETAITKTFRIRNLADVGALTLSGSPAVTVSGTGASNFSVITQPLNNIGPGTNTSFSIRFNPSAEGIFEVTVSIPNNDLDESPYSFTIRGTGKALPTASITAESEVCQTADLVLSTPLVSGASYAWTGSGVVSENSNTVIANPTATGTQLYTVTVSAANGCSVNSTHSVTVNPASIPTVHSTVTQSVSTGNLFANSCAFLAMVTPSGASPVSGLVTVQHWLETDPTFMVRRHYEITPNTSPETSTGTVRLYFTQEDFTAYNATISSDFLPANPAASTSNLRIAKYAGVSSPNNGLPGNYTSTPSVIVPTSVNWNATLSLWEVNFDVTSGFSGFYVFSVSQPLPVTLVSFQGKSISASQNLLSWTTGEEKDFSHFEITRSADAVAFETIGRVEAQPKSGTQLKSYTFQDREANSEIYYRLKMVDLDGSVKLSNIIAVTTKDAGSIVGTPYPNPVSTDGKVAIDIQVETQAVWTLQTFDALGVNVHSEKIMLKKGLNTIRINQLKSGINLIRLSDGTETMVRKVIKP